MRGFSLYEVLIVMALIGYVAAIGGSMTASLHRTDRHTAVYVKDVTDLRHAVRTIERDLRAAKSVRDLDYRHEDESLLRGERVVARNIAVFEVSEQDGLFGFEVRYRYTWSGAERESMHYAAGYEPSPNPVEAEALSAQYPSGAATVCFVNPMNPDQAALRRGNVAATASDLLLALGAGLLFFLPLAFSLFICISALAMATLEKAKIKAMPTALLSRFGSAYQTVILLLCRSFGSIIYGFATLPFIWWFRSRSVMM